MPPPPAARSRWPGPVPVTLAATAGCLGGLVTGRLLMLVGPAEGPADTVMPGWVPSAARAVLDITGVAVVGLALLPLLVRPARPRDRANVLVAAHRGLVVTGAGWAAAAAVLLWLQAADATGTPPLSLPLRRVGDYLGAAVGGRALLVPMCCGLGLAAAGVLAARRPAAVPAGLLPVPAVAGLLAVPVTGHATTATAHELAVLAVAVHVAGAGAWIGSLAGIGALVLPRRELLVAVLPGYSRLAGACLLGVVATGVLGAVLRLPSPAATVTTSYGWILLGKAAGVLVLGLLGGYARQRLLPGVLARRVHPGGWLAAELVTMGAVLGLAAVLAGAPPPA